MKDQFNIDPFLLQTLIKSTKRLTKRIIPVTIKI